MIFKKDICHWCLGDIIEVSNEWGDQWYHEDTGFSWCEKVREMILPIYIFYGTPLQSANWCRVTGTEEIDVILATQPNRLHGRRGIPRRIEVCTWTPGMGDFSRMIEMEYQIERLEALYGRFVGPSRECEVDFQAGIQFPFSNEAPIKFQDRND